MNIRKPLGIHLGLSQGAVALPDATDSTLLTGMDAAGQRAVATFDGSPERLTPQTTARVLHRLREMMDRSANDPRYLFDSAVLALPVSFSPDQIEAVRQAGILAGFEVVELLQEPVAAAVFYSWAAGQGDSTYLVYNLNERAFDAAVVRKCGARFEMLGWAARGGDSETEAASVEIPLDGCQEALARAGLRLGDVDHVLLAGRSCRSTLVREAVRAAFCNPELADHAGHPEPLVFEPDLCMALGAAVRGTGHGVRFLFPGVLELLLTSPFSTREVRYRATGTAQAVVTGEPGRAALEEGSSVRIRSLGTGLAEEAFLDERGAFAQEIELVPETDNSLEFAICDGAGEERARVVAAVRQQGKVPLRLAGTEGEIITGTPALLSVLKGGVVELDPPWPQFARLVRRCLDLAAEVAQGSGRDREELFEHVYAQERYAEQAHKNGDLRPYRECCDNLQQYAGYLESLLRNALPRPPVHPLIPPEEEARVELERFRADLAQVWKEVRLKYRADLEASLNEVASQARGFSQRVKTEPQALLHDLGRLGAEVRRVEELLRSAPPGTPEGA